jgi:2-amino-1-hydroxyethylphosphonate dioxygenase (glycine-forming)
MKREEAVRVVEEIFSLYEKHGQSDYIGEPVSQIEHMCQAGLLAEKEGYDDEVVLAAFFHDIGHLLEFIMPVEHMEGVGVMDHEKIGQEYLLEKGFSMKIAKLVSSHVEAKRYLTFKHPAYYDRLSDASKITLEHQGGRMSEVEATSFEKDPMFNDYIKMRTWDDLAKETNMPLPSLDVFKSKAINHLINQN